MRYIIFLLLFLILVPMLRGVLGIVAKLLMSWAVGPNSNAAARRAASAPPAAAPGTSSTTALHKDPVCGIYVSEAAAVSCRDGNQTLWFCSTACLDKYRKGV
jgi:YHS domain-containing protein